MNWSFPRRRLLVPWDTAVLFLTPWVAGSLTSGNNVAWREFFTPLMGAAIVASVLLLRQARLYRRLWAQASMEDLERLLLATSAAAVLVALVTATSRNAQQYPALEAVLTAAMLVPLLAGPRIAVALAARRRMGTLAAGGHAHARPRALVVGVGPEARQLAQALLEQPQPNSALPVAFLCDDHAMSESLLLGLPIRTPTARLAAVAEEVDASEVLVADPGATGERMRAWFRDARAAGLAIRTVPSLAETSGHHAGSSTEVRDIRIEDLLRRAPRRADTQSVARLVAGRTVCVTGAGGSIGSELCRQLAAAGARELLLVGRGENSIFEIDRELARRWPQVARRAVILDVRNAAAIDRMLRSYKPSVVFHAAAHKHVPYMEHEPAEALAVNVVGTWRLAEACAAANIERFVLVSTDKAVSPVNAMGASKRAAEIVVRSIAQRERKPWAVVRFGNVLGSRGSVVPTFLQQIRSGGPVTLTDKRMTRYFMTIPEAASLVLEAAANADCEGALYMLDMGQPVRIADLAEDVIRLAGHEPGVDMEIVESGLRPGELLHERLTRDDERLVATTVEGLLAVERVGTGGDPRHVLAALPSIARDVDRGLRDDEEARDVLGMLVGEYARQCPDSTSTAPDWRTVMPDSESTNFAEAELFSVSGVPNITAMNDKVR